MTRRLRITGCLAWCLFLAPVASAHVSGNSIEKQVGPYLIDIGYDAFVLTIDQPTVFNALLIENAGTFHWDYAPYTNVTFTFLSPSGERAIYERAVQPPASGYIEHAFTETGQHTLAVRYANGNQELAATEFALGVSLPPLTRADWRIAVAGIVLVSGATLGLSYMFTRGERRARKT
jgi:hypothetical protein